MALFDTDVKITADGVYRPLHVWVDVIGCTIVLLLLGRQLYLEKIPLYAALLLTILLCGTLIYKRIKYGKTGIPFVKLSPSELIIFLAADSRGKIRFDLHALHEIQIYGRVKRRKYRFLRHDGTFVDVTPFFGIKVEQAVIQFLMTSLPTDIVVKICEPQTFFEEIRGDGP